MRELTGISGTEAIAVGERAHLSDHLRHARWATTGFFLLLGTVLGVMDAFIGIAVGGSGNISAVAPGVAEALVTTVAGLAVAVPAVIAYNIFVNRLGVFAGELEGFAQEIIATLAREGRL